MAKFQAARQRRFARRFLGATAKALFPRDAARRRAFHDQAMAQGATLYAERADRLPDAASRYQESHRALVLASVRSAAALGVRRAEAIETVGGVYRELSQEVPKRFYGLLLAFAPDPLSVLQKLGMADGLRRMMGQDMVARDDVGPHHYALVVEGCAYNAFFQRHGEPEVTLVFCRADRAWMDAINRSRRSLAVSRPSTQSTGAERCIFRYENVTGARKPDIDVAAAASAGARASRIDKRDGDVEPA